MLKMKCLFIHIGTTALIIEFQGETVENLDPPIWMTF